MSHINQYVQPTFTTIVRMVPTANISAYSIHNVANAVMVDMIAGAPRGAKCKTSFSLMAKNGLQFLVCTIALQNMKGTLLDKALVISEDAAVATEQYHANSRPGDTITCACGSKKFYDLDRSRFYHNHICASCGAPAQTLTETGACT